MTGLAPRPNKKKPRYRVFVISATPVRVQALGVLSVLWSPIETMYRFACGSVVDKLFGLPSTPSPYGLKNLQVAYEPTP
jgi:hypothetical protein